MALHINVGLTSKIHCIVNAEQTYLYELGVIDVDVIVLKCIYYKYAKDLVRRKGSLTRAFLPSNCLRIDRTTSHLLTICQVNHFSFFERTLIFLRQEVCRPDARLIRNCEGGNRQNL